MPGADLIRRYRAADATLTVLDEHGEPVADEDVVVAQRRHRFHFGGTDFDLVDLANGELEGERREVVERSASAFLDLFDFATLPFYWGRFEPVRGQPDTERIRTAAQWLVDRGCLVKGHPLCWHTVTADWLLDLPVDEVIDVQLARIRRDVAEFAGLIDTWDVINEVVIMPVFDRGENGITRMAQRARTGRDRRCDVRRCARDEPRRDAAAQRLRHVRRLRAPHRGLSRGRDPGSTRSDSNRTCTRATGASRRPRTCSTGSRGSGCRCTSPRPRSCPGT